jgi:hypothetical protein
MHSRELESMLLVPTSARQLVEDVVVLGQELPGDVESHRVGAVRADDRGKALGGHRQRIVPRYRCGRKGTVRTKQRLRGPTGAHGSQVQRVALGAQAAKIGWVVGIAAHADDPLAGRLYDHPAAGAAVAADAAGFR